MHRYPSTMQSLLFRPRQQPTDVIDQQRQSRSRKLINRLAHFLRLALSTTEIIRIRNTRSRRDARSQLSHSLCSISIRASSPHSKYSCITTPYPAGQPLPGGPLNCFRREKGKASQICHSDSHDLTILHSLENCFRTVHGNGH